MTAAAQGIESDRIIGRWKILGKIGAGGFADVYTALPVETADRLGTEFVLDADSGVLVPLVERGFEEEGRVDAESEILGRAFAQVALARRRSQDRRRAGVEQEERPAVVALKVARPGGEAEVVRGARTQAALRHPGIVRVLDASGLESDPPCVALEWIRGGSLRDVLARRGRLAPGEALRVVARLLEVLEHAHGRGVVHGDVKPENVLVEPGTGPLEKRVRLTDFGLRRRLHGAPGAGPSGSLAASLASASVAVAAGTPAYLAPEALAGAEGDARIDVYACGVLAFELATGVRPQGSDRPSDIVPGIPEELDRIVREAMRGDPARRYRSAEAMRAAIHEVLPSRAVRHAAGRELDPRALFSEAESLIRPRSWPLFATAAAVHFLGGLSFGVLGAPLHGALIESIRDAHEGRKGRVLERLGGQLANWLPLLAAFWLQAVCIAVGLSLFVVPGVYLAARWLYVGPVIALEGLPLPEALRRSAALAHGRGIGAHMIVATVLLLVGAVGISFSWLGWALVGPLCVGVPTIAYLQATR